MGNTKSARKNLLYEELVSSKYQVFNSLFMNLPYEKTENIGMLLPILRQESKAGFKAGKNPIQIIEEFFSRHTEYLQESEQMDFLFRVVQYVERQVVLYDSIEDAAFRQLRQYSDDLTVKRIARLAASHGKSNELKRKLEDFGIRIVFTAHPTQFYPETVQYIIEDLRSAISGNNIKEINQLLKQLGKTSFLKDTKPTPYDEAISIIYYLRYVYYEAVGKLYQQIRQTVDFQNENLIQLGFWPGGDRDGNPYVSAEITREVADELRMSLLKSYYNHLKMIRRRITFKSVKPRLDDLSDKLYAAMFDPKQKLAYWDILNPLLSVEQILIDQHEGLFTEILEEIIVRVRIFKTHFASLDIRQDSSIHIQLVQEIVEKYNLADQHYNTLGQDEKLKILLEGNVVVDEKDFADPVLQDTIKNIKQLGKIQEFNGEQGCHRYIISNSEDIFAVFHVLGLFRFCGWNMDDIHFDIVPLFETIQGLSNAENVMQELYNHPVYSRHLESRRKKQAIMLGFSDGTKDGGYLKANLEIHNTKEILSKVSEQNDIQVVFFDGRGGPPARGGGKTHRFYASHGKSIANNELHLTIQGQTITSMYGTVDQFMFQCEQLITAGVSNDILDDEKTHINDDEKALLQELGNRAFEKYDSLKNHPSFVPYLEKMSTLKYYGRVNISSRPAKRGKTKELTLADLRAISFVGSWSQLKQNVPGYYGMGTALAQLKSQGRMEELKALFSHVSFFKTLILNSMMSLCKTFFPLTSYMKNNEEFGPFWEMLFEEFNLSVEMMLEVSGYDSLMEEEPMAKNSIQMREQIVLPLLTIQQYALQKIAEGTENQKVYESLVTRSLFGNINASRNSA
jgi:phosphoenolpyruvate carboxylase